MTAAVTLAGAKPATVQLDERAEGPLARLAGAVVLEGIAAVQGPLDGLSPARPVTIDLAEATGLDTAGAWVVATTVRRTKGSVVNATAAQQSLIETVTHALPAERHDRPRRKPVHVVEDLGRMTATGSPGADRDHRVLRAGGRAAGAHGLSSVAAAADLARVPHPAGRVQRGADRRADVVPDRDRARLSGADQLRQFGAEVFVVDLIAVSVLRELGILLTAIIVAGRSASAFTAAIGSMKMREEVDAMRTLGLDPVELLVLPRVLALVIFLPVLGLVADLAGLLGGMLMSWFALGISPGAFRTRLLDTDVSHYVVGLVKAPFFAVIIGVVGCFQGLQVEGNADSLGRLTSRSVVQAIFMVILADATFSILFATAGI